MEARGRLRKAGKGCAVIGLAVSSAGCLIAEGDVTKIEVLPVRAQKLELGENVIGGLAEVMGLSFPFSDSMVSEARRLEGAKSVRLGQLALRTTTGDGDDHRETALKDPSLVTKCRKGQPPITWIRSIEVRITKVGEPETESWLARHVFDEGEIARARTCGFFMTVNTELNLVGFLPSFRLTLDARATVPGEDLYLGGFSTIFVQGRFAIPGGLTEPERLSGG